MTPSIEAARQMGEVGGPAVEAERLAFEAWMAGHCWQVGGRWDGRQYIGRGEDGGLIDAKAMDTRRLWAAWRDRAALAAAQPPVAQADPIVEAWLLGHALQYLVLGGHDDEWNDFSGGGKPNTGSKRLAWRLKPTAQPPAAMPVPPGMALAPVEATPAMCKAAVIFANGSAVYKNVATEALKIEEAIYGEAYAAMLAAAPKAQAQSVPATGAQPLAVDVIREAKQDAMEVFDAEGPETPQIVRDVIEYMTSWLEVYAHKRASPTAPTGSAG